MEFLDQGLRRLLRPAQIRLFLVILGLEVASFLAGSVYPMSVASAVATTASYTNSTKAIYALNPFSMWFEIVSHNALITTLELFPILGILVNFISTFTTGQILHASVLAAGNMSFTAGPLLVIELFIFPHTIVEFSAYALATSCSILFFLTLMKWWSATKVKAADGTSVYFQKRNQVKAFEDAIKNGKAPKTWTVNGNVFGPASISYDDQTGDMIEEAPSQSFMEKYEPTSETLRIFSRGIAASFILLAIAGIIETVIINSPLIGLVLWLPVILGIRYLAKWNDKQKSLNTV